MKSAMLVMGGHMNNAKKIPELAETSVDQPPPILTMQDKTDFLATVEPQFIGEAEEHWDDGAARIEHKNKEWDRAQAIATRDIMRQLLVFTKPVLTMDEGAALLDVSTKRFSNILYEEKARLGHFPDFVCDAGGVITRRVIRDELIEWVKRSRRSKGRPIRRK